jgi:NDP-sugar pyrophosphorylase family protein
MTICRNDDPAHANNVEYEGGEILAYSKAARTPRMRHIDYGFSVFRAEVFAGLPTDAPSDLAAITEDLAARGQLIGFEVPNRFHEVGSFSGLAALEAHFAGTVR